MRNINEKLLVRLQGPLMQHSGTETQQEFTDVSRRILTAVAALFSDGPDGVSIGAFRQAQNACRDGIEISGADSLDALDCREVLSVLSDMTQAHGRDQI